MFAHAPKLGQSRVRLDPGDTWVMFTDGLTESRDGDGRMFEQDGLAAALHRLRDAPVQTLVDDLSSSAAAADDIALLAIRVKERRGD